MIVFLDEDRAYVSWVTHHRQGFVLDATRKLSPKLAVLHRATCAEIKQSATPRTHWTTGRHLKACALDVEQLLAWFREQREDEPQPCPACDPLSSQPPASGLPTAKPRLTKLGSEILTLVLEMAAVHLDTPDPPYALDVGYISRCLQKTPAQLTAAVKQLVDNGFVTIRGRYHPERSLPQSCVILPTILALRTLPSYAGFDDAALMLELALLTGGGE